MLKVLVVGQTPPPYGGTPIMVERFLKSDFADVKLIHVRMAFASHIKDHGSIHPSKIIPLISLVFRIVYHRFADGARVLYFVPAGPDRVTMLRDFAILLPTRWLFDKTIFHFHLGGVSELYDHLPSWQRWLFRRAYFGADAAIRISELNPEDGRRLQAKRDYVIPNGIDDPCPESVDSPSNLAKHSSGPLRILFVGMLRESKGLMVLIDACRKLAAQGIPFQLEVMGQWKSEEFASRVRERIHEWDLDGQVRFLGVQIGDDKFAAYRRSNVFCMPTFFSSETFGLVFVEAMACRLPVVSTRWRGIPSVVNDNTTGFLVEPRDADSLADRLAVLAGDPELRDRMGRAGRAKFEREYLFSRHASRMRRALLESAGASPEEVLEAAPDVVQNPYIAERRTAVRGSHNRLDTEVFTP